MIGFDSPSNRKERDLAFLCRARRDLKEVQDNAELDPSIQIVLAGSNPHAGVPTEFCLIITPSAGPWKDRQLHFLVKWEIGGNTPWVCPIMPLPPSKTNERCSLCFPLALRLIHARNIQCSRLVSLNLDLGLIPLDGVSSMSSRRLVMIMRKIRAYISTFSTLPHVSLMSKVG